MTLLREMAENQIGPRLERAEGVAAVTTKGGLRRQIHVQLSKEKIAALDLPVDRFQRCSARRTRTHRWAK